MTLLKAGTISWIRKSPSIHVNQSLNFGPWFASFFWWIPSAATLSHCMRSSMVILFAKPTLSTISLVKPFLAERPTVGLGIGLQNKISIMLRRNADETIEDNVEYPRYGERKQRCDICLFNISGVEQNKKKDTLKKLKSCCQKCGSPVCEKHSKLVCQKHL